MVVFSFLTGDINWRDYGGKWCSNPQSTILEGKRVEYWYILSLDNWENSTGGRHNGNRYVTSLEAIAPDLILDKDKQRALAFCGLEGGLDHLAPRHRIPALLECLSSYGNVCPIREWEGNNAGLLLQQAKKLAREIASNPNGIQDCFSKPVNKLGSTGLEYMAGDIYACLDRGPDSPEKGIVRQMLKASGGKTLGDYCDIQRGGV